MASGRRRARSLSSLVTSAGLLVGVLGVLGAAFGARELTRRYLGREVDGRLSATAQRTAVLIGLYLSDRREQLALLASNPAVIAAARAGAAAAAQRGLVTQPVDDLERSFRATRSLDVDPVTSGYLRHLTEAGDFAEIFVTETHGFNVASSGLTSDFVQSDEAWWQTATRGEGWLSEPDYDSSAAVVVVDLAVPVGGNAGLRLGVLKASFNLWQLGGLAASADSSLTVEVVDRASRMMAGPAGATLQAAPWTLPPAGDTAVFAELGAGAARERAAVAGVPSTTWRVVVHAPEHALYATQRRISRVMIALTIVLLALLVSGLVAAGGWLQQRLTQPVARLAGTASAVAQGDLTRDVDAGPGTAEVTALAQSLDGMVSALRRLVGAIQSSADEAAAMAAEISASTEEMAAAGQEMAGTTQELSRRAQDQAEVVKAAAADATRMLEIAERLADQARRAAERNRTLVSLAEDYRAEMQHSSAALDGLAGEVQHASAEATALLEASQQVG